MTINEIKKRAKEEFGVVYPFFYSDETIRTHFENMCAAAPNAEKPAPDSAPRKPKGKRKG